MVATTLFKSDFDDFKTSTDAITSFHTGELFKEHPEQYFATVIRICTHFKNGINTVQNFMNQIITASNKFEKDFSEGADFIDEHFNVLEDYVDFICSDFEAFKNAVVVIVPKENLEYRCKVDFNLVEQIITDLHKNVERVRTQLLSYFISNLSDKELEGRASAA